MLIKDQLFCHFYVTSAQIHAVPCRQIKVQMMTCQQPGIIISADKITMCETKHFARISHISEISEKSLTRNYTLPMRPTIDASDFIQIEAVIRLKIGEIIVLGRRPSARVCHRTLRRQIFNYFVASNKFNSTTGSSCNTDMSKRNN